MKAAVINLSAPHYNLGASKLANWLQSQGWEVESFSGDPGMFIAGFELLCLSAIFSWDVPAGLEIVFRAQGVQIWAGGPGFFGLAAWWKQQTGFDPVIGLDPRFEHHRGTYRMTYASRGCPVGCHFCNVPKWEGRTFTLDWDFQPAPILCDNNLSALPTDFQRHIVKRYTETGTRLLDANSGFEPATFNEATYDTWRPILRGPWRFAFDYMPEWRAVKKVCEILKSESVKRKRVYVLIGNEPMESCYERCQMVRAWGGEPYCQAQIALDARNRKPLVKHDWTLTRLKHFMRFFNRYAWKSCYSLADYRCRKLRPFADLEFAKVMIT